MDLLASTVKSASIDELKILAVHISHDCGDADPDGPGVREGGHPTEQDLMCAIHDWGNWAVSRENAK